MKKPLSFYFLASILQHAESGEEEACTSYLTVAL